MKDYILVPLHGKSGAGKVTKVDAGDADRVLAHRWYVDSGGYALRREGRTVIRLHHFILGAKRRTDHANRDKLDNRKANLRPATQRENSRNRSPRAGCSSRFKGVARTGSKWTVHIRVDNRNHFLGTFADEDAAARTYDAAARHHFGEFAVTNFPSGESIAVAELRRRHIRASHNANPIACAHCGRDFNPDYAGKRFCSRECHYQHKAWTPEEDEVIRSQYPFTPAHLLRGLLPRRSIAAIRARGEHHGIIKRPGWSGRETEGP